MQMQANLNKYQQSTVRTVSREKLLLMLFDGAISFANASGSRLAAGDKVGFREYLLKSQAIVTEFLTTLDMEVGGEVAANLQQIYLFLIDHMTEANVRLLGKNMNDVARILGTIREGFDGAIRSLAGSHEIRAAR
ncbi:MAG TPA: flagellar export chaperone FliS [Candidatus Deferrimicrobiaceae bacterium]|jgi:flagellar protein FliS